MESFRGYQGLSSNMMSTQIGSVALEQTDDDDKKDPTTVVND
jgi:hypothetical protein